MQNQTFDGVIFSPLEQEAGGNCLFYSLCASPYIPFDDHSTLRMTICDFALEGTNVIPNRIFEAFKKDTTSCLFADHFNDMKNDRTTAGTIDILLVCL